MKLRAFLKAAPRKSLFVFLCLLVLASVLSFWIGRSSLPVKTGAPPSGEAKETTYYCTMHPHIRLPHPGKCSICGMDLVPLEASTDPGPRAISISDAAVKLAEIETETVTRRTVEAEIRLVGKIDFDESQVRTITSWVPGRLDRLYVDYTGILIKKGDHLADIYSPKLFQAQQELISALEAVENVAQSDSRLVRDSTRKTLDAVREKLRLLGLSVEQVKAIEARRTPSDHILISAPSSGVVVSKLADEGDYVDTGSPVYKIAELTRLWAQLDAYESDLTWLRYGQRVEFYTEAYPGEMFHGTISFMDWVVDPRTRTVRVRVNVDNTAKKLKPGMFIRALVHSSVGGGGVVMDPALKGKWISPMHPEIVKDGPGACDVCGMDLVPAEELFSSVAGDDKPPLVIPASAALLTGRRAVVYVKLPDRARPTFEGREVVLGPRAGEHYLVLSGLEEGEEVVVRGNFKIDSALQIQAKPSMMQPKGGKPPAAHHPHHGGQAGTTPEGQTRFGEPPMAPLPLPVPQKTPRVFEERLERLWQSYFKIGELLSGDDLKSARDSLTALDKLIGEDWGQELEAPAAKNWKTVSRRIKREARDAAQAKDLGALRDRFRSLSHLMMELETAFGHAGGSAIYEVFCPMAFDGEGDLWLQREKTISNPYFGKMMLRCGDIRREFSPRAADGAKPESRKRSGEGHSHD